MLPLIGLQHRIVAFLPEQGQAIIACLAMLLGCPPAGLLVARRPRAQRLVKASLGWALLDPPGIVLAGIAIWRIANGQNHPQPADAPPPFGAPPGPPGPAIPGLPPEFGGQPAAPSGDVGDESMYTLSNAQAARATGPLGNVRAMGVDFRVDYRGSGPMHFGPIAWVVESPRTKARDPIVHLQPGGGTLAGTLMFDRGDTGPFKTYLAYERGGSLVKVSNTVDMVWKGDQGIGDAPGPGPGMPTMPGPMPGPQPVGPMPGGFRGPRGPFGPRGPMPGPPPGFPRPPGRP